MSGHFMSCSFYVQVMLCYVRPCCVKSGHVLSCQVILCRVTICYLRSCCAMSSHVMSCHVKSGHVKCQVMPCHAKCTLFKVMWIFMQHNKICLHVSFFLEESFQLSPHLYCTHTCYPNTCNKLQVCK